MQISIQDSDTKAVVVIYENGREFELLEPIQTTYRCDGKLRIVYVPRCFVTDFASVPRPLWAWIPPTGKYVVASVVHDWLYVAHITTRREADALFHALMLFLGVGPIRARLIYCAVRLGGRKYWSRF